MQQPVQITLEFKSLEDAIVALGKLAGVGPNVTVQPSLVKLPAPADAPPAVEKKPRKPRADAGQPRGPYNKDANATVEAGTASSTVGSGVADTATAGKQADPSKAAEQAANSTSTPPAVAPATQTAAPTSAAPASTSGSAPAPAAAVPSQEDVQKAVEKLFNAKDFDTTSALLSRFGVKRGKDLAEDKRADFIRRVDGVIAGEAV